MNVVNTLSGANTSFDHHSLTALTDSIDREIYNRLQLVPLAPLGSLPKDKVAPIKDYIDQMEKIQADTQTNQAAIRIDTFVGSLGVSQYYPHPDNIFKGDLL